jgi:protein-tyrosine phosphatase
MKSHIAWVIVTTLGVSCLAAACQETPTTVDSGPDADVEEPDSDTDADADADTDSGTPPSRWIELEGAINTRDLGGYPVEGGKTIRWRTLVRSGHLSDLTETGCAAFDELGIVTVVDLRMDSERSESPQPECVTTTASVVPVAMQKILPPSAENYLALMEVSDDAVASLFSELSKADDYPVLYHCIIGRDRVNFATALIMSALGASRETILEEYRLGEGVEDAWIEAVLDEVDGRGGIEPYLSAVGVPAADLEALRGLALE